jgi:hypothetical protein
MTLIALNLACMLAEMALLHVRAGTLGRLKGRWLGRRQSRCG